MELDFKRPRRGLGILIGSINGVLVLYAAAWIAGVGDLRRLTDWRGPVAAVVLAIVLGAAILIQQIQALE